MQPSDFWKEYVGEQSPQEFLGPDRPQTTEDLHARVRQYVAQIPSFYGIVLRGAWKHTWSDYCYTREQVADGLICHLEAVRPEWDNTSKTEPDTPPPEDPAVSPPASSAPPLWNSD